MAMHSFLTWLFFRAALAALLVAVAYSAVGAQTLGSPRSGIDGESRYFGQDRRLSATLRDFRADRLGVAPAFDLDRGRPGAAVPPGASDRGGPDNTGFGAGLGGRGGGPGGRR
jgi:hypothetical protein